MCSAEIGVLSSVEIYSQQTTQIGKVLNGGYSNGLTPCKRGLIIFTHFGERTKEEIAKKSKTAQNCQTRSF